MADSPCLRKSNRIRSYPYPYCLCVIDVQTGFNSAFKVVESCQQVLRKAIADGAFIVIAQYYNYGQTYDELISVLKEEAEPDQYGFCSANMDCKEQSITRLLYDRNIQVGKFIVCGINTSACVQRTVKGISSNHPEKTVTVLQDACADNDTVWHQHGLKTMKEYANVTIGSM